MKNIQHKELTPEIFNLKGWISCVDKTKIEKDFTRLLEKSGFCIVKYSSYEFPVKGFTSYWLLAESHLAIHSFEESSFSYIELSSCNQIKAEYFFKLANNTNFKIQWDGAITTYSAPGIKKQEQQHTA